MELLSGFEPLTSSLPTSKYQTNNRNETRNPVLCGFPISVSRPMSADITATQSPRSQLSVSVTTVGGGLHGAEPTFNPALRLAIDTHHSFTRGGPQF